MSINVSLRFQRNDFLLDVTFAAPESGVTAIFGPSGSGKTTLLRAIAGLESAQGTVRIGNKVWQDAHHRMPVHEREVGYVFQEASLFDHLNVQGNLNYGLNRTPLTRRRIEFQRICSLLGLEHLLERSTVKLSGGERQRVAIGRALLSSPRLLLLDEPLASLDTQMRSELLPFLERLTSELDLPILYVSHATDEVARLADQLILLESGKMLAAGPVNEVLTRLDLPIAHSDSSAAIIVATKHSYDSAFDLTEVAFSGGRLFVPGNVSDNRKNLRLRIMARDVSIALEEPVGSSILNIVQATVSEIEYESAAQAVLRLEAGGTTFIARLTRKSLDKLGIHTGKTVFAQIKTVALLN